MQFCAVRGCGSNSADTTHKFHPIPTSLIPRARWMIALGPLPKGSLVCSLHFDPGNFDERGRLLKSALPKPFENVPPNAEPCPDFSEIPVEEGSAKLVACRVCLVASGRLYAISGSSIEDSFAKLTGVTAAKEKRFPRYLCGFCLVKLSKCATFRDACQRSTAVLQTLMENGRLEMNVIKAIDRDAHRLGNDLTCHKVFQFDSDQLLNLPAVFKTEAEDSYECADNTEVDYLDDKYDIKEGQNAKADDGATFKMKKLDTDSKIIDDEEEATFQMKNLDTDSKIIDDVEDSVEIVENVARDVEVQPSVINIFKLKSGLDAAFGKKYNFKMKVLSKREQKQLIEERKRDSNSPFCCARCGKGCASERGLRTHTQDSHNPSFPFACDVCGHRYQRRRALRWHQTDHGAVLTCLQCGYVCQRRTLARHHFSLHAGRKHTCPHCRAQFDRASTYYLHVKQKHAADNEACDECGETFKGAEGLKMHKRRQHPKIVVDTKCTVCEVAFSSAEALQRHEQSSVGASHAALFPCGACGQSCGSDAARAAHVAEKHKADQLHCDECDKTFSSAAAFALHSDRKHKSVRPPARERTRYGYAPRRPRAPAACVCERCGKRFLCAATLQYHMNTHLGLSPFQCPHCPKGFANPLNLKCHLRIHTGERPYQCEQCPRSFTAQGNFNRHMKNVHRREQVSCDLCGKQVGASSLRSHIRAVHMKMPYLRRKRNRTAKKRDRTES